MEIETLRAKVLELEAELSAVKQELEDAHKEIEKGAKALEKKKRQLETANTYNDDLCEQMTALSREIQDFRDKQRTRKEIGLQAVAEEILTGIDITDCLMKVVDGCGVKWGLRESSE